MACQDGVEETLRARRCRGAMGEDPSQAKGQCSWQFSGHMDASPNPESRSLPLSTLLGAYPRVFRKPWAVAESTSNSEVVISVCPAEGNFSAVTTAAAPSTKATPAPGLCWRAPGS